MLDQGPAENTVQQTIAGNPEERERHKSNPHSPSPDFAALIDAIKNEGIAYRNEEQTEDSGKSFREWITIFLLFVTVVAIGWQVNEMIKVYKPIKDQADAAGRAADYARDTAKAASEQSKAATAQAQKSDLALEEAQRAWIGPDNATIDAAPTVGKTATISITYHNTGREPARGFIYGVNPFPFLVSDEKKGKLGPIFAKYMQACFAEKPRANAGVVYPSTGFGGATLTTTIDGKKIDQAVIDGKSEFIVQGCFVYETFQKPHHSAFCYFWRGDISKPPNMNICMSGNNAD